MEKKSESFQLFIKSLDDQKLEYNIDPSITIAEFKDIISKDTSLDKSKIRLIY